MSVFLGSFLGGRFGRHAIEEAVGGAEHAEFSATVKGIASLLLLLGKF